MYFIRFLCINLILIQWLTISYAQEIAPPQIHTVLPFDQIPAIWKPEFVSAKDADIHADSPVIGVVLGNEAHAYSMILLNHHEIVNDVLNNQPIATTW